MPSQYRKRILKWSAIVLAVIAALIGAVYGRYRYTFPYGWSHCCLKGLGLALYTTKGSRSGSVKGCFLVAVGQCAVRLLSEHEHVFRRFTGSADLALFSIFRWAAFADMLLAER
jgi:hypothetical protein